ncbi:MAG: pantoate--beta-alanine ligase [Ignavibacteria bacterium]|nr:pantoate--beta-alanine ligase [Ignavibacteria bacterium]
MKVIKEIAAMQDVADYFRCVGKKIGFVPTMGFLHKGHVSLIDKAKEENDVVVVSIFVNPTQFLPGEDFEKYPRDFLKDYFSCEKAGVDYIFHPSVEEMYSAKSRTRVVVSEITDSLEGKARPDHFTGVATVVAKLFNIVKPNIAYFGQKDAQQAVVIRQVSEDLNFDLKVSICPTVREENGLALSSRNSYLSDAEIEEAAAIYKGLCEGKKLVINNSVSDSNAVIGKIGETIKANSKNINIEYIEITDNCDLKKIYDLSSYKGDVLISLAAKLGDTRLIDNILFTK